MARFSFSESFEIFLFDILVGPHNILSIL